MFEPLVAMPADLSPKTVLLVLVALAIGVLLARKLLSVAWKVLVLAILGVGAVYAAGVLL